jgi:hypothetical protein
VLAFVKLCRRKLLGGSRCFAHLRKPKNIMCIKIRIVVIEKRAVCLYYKRFKFGPRFGRVELNTLLQFARF